MPIDKASQLARMMSAGKGNFVMRNKQRRELNECCRQAKHSIRIPMATYNQARRLKLPPFSKAPFAPLEDCVSNGNLFRRGDDRSAFDSQFDGRRLVFVGEFQFFEQLHGEHFDVAGAQRVRAPLAKVGDRVIVSVCSYRDFLSDAKRDRNLNMVDRFWSAHRMATLSKNGFGDSLGRIRSLRSSSRRSMSSFFNGKRLSAKLAVDPE